MTQRRYWTKDEEKFLEKNLDIMTTQDFAEHFSRSKEQVIKKIHRMGLSIKKAHNVLWTNNDDMLLKKHFEYAPKNYLMHLFPNRTWPSIFQRGSKTLKLNRKSQDKYSIDYNFFSRWTEESAYFLGFILTDGHIHYGESKYLQFEIQKRDVDILQKFKSCTNFEGKILKGKQAGTGMILGKKCNYQESVKMQINNAKIILDLNKKGVPLDTKTYITKFPENIPESMIRHFIRGAIDGDGSISYNKKNQNAIAISFCGNYDLVKGIKDHFPVDCSANNIFKSSDHCWNFTVSGKKGNHIADWLYQDATIYLNSKYNIYKCYLDAQKFSVVEEIRQGHNSKTSNS